LDVGWLPTSLWGPFGVAAAIGKLLAFDKETMLNAFGLAYSQIHGNREALIEGRLAKRMQPAFSSVAGLNAAFLASCGISAGNRLIDGPYGISHLYTKGQADTEALSGALGTRWECTNISIKPYPCCRCTHPVIDAALFLKDRYRITGTDIKEADIYLPPTAMGQIGRPFTLSGNPTVAAQFSAAYTASLVFMSGRPGLKDFKKEAVVSAKETASLAQSIRVHEFAKDGSGLVPVELTVKTKAGQTYKTRVEKIKGAPDNPLTEEEQFIKFSDNIKNGFPKISGSRVKKLYATIRDTVSADNISRLTADISID
jgi:2-methylcitrate dehydratase PrpD